MSKSARAAFAETLADMNASHATHFENECEKFGMIWGCAPDCPVFERGECELQEENEEIFREEQIYNETGQIIQYVPV